MNKDEKALRNDVIDILEEFERILLTASKSGEVYFKTGVAGNMQKFVRRVNVAFRDVTLKLDEEIE